MFAQASIALCVLLPLIAASPVRHLAAREDFVYTQAKIVSGRNGQCLSINGPLSDGSPVTTNPCYESTLWDISPGSGTVVVSGTNFALDAGGNPHDFVPAKVWTSYPGLTQQTWYLTGDNRIAITGGTQCLDEGDNGPQTYTCTTGNANQVWYVVPKGASTASASISPSPTASASPAPSATSSSSISQIKWVHGDNQCLEMSGPIANGSPIQLASCDGSNSNQIFNVTQGGEIRLFGYPFCFDAGSDPSNGGDLKIWSCYPGLPQQNWQGITNYREQTANNQCIDIDDSNYARMQTWECSSTDPNQQFVIEPAPYYYTEP